MTNLKIKRVHETVVLPTYGTSQAACFDLYAHLQPFKTFKFIGPIEEEDGIGESFCEIKMQKDYVGILPGERFLIPTGIKLDIPEGYCVKLYSRSGLSFRSGLVLTNGVGIIDSDYVDEIFISLTNIGNQEVIILNGDRIAQAELVPVGPRVSFEEIFEDIAPKGDRTGGFGSTDVVIIDEYGDDENDDGKTPIL